MLCPYCKKEVTERIIDRAKADDQYKVKVVLVCGCGLRGTVVQVEGGEQSGKTVAQDAPRIARAGRVDG